MFQVELIWNREFNFVPYGNPFQSLEKAIEYSEVLENMGGGERVKSTRIVDQDGVVVYIHGKRVNPPSTETVKRSGADLVSGFDCLG